MSPHLDVIVLGAGMAGASLAAELAPQRKVLLLELEDQPGRHATGRSAAMFFESYGNATVRALTRASRAFLENPPAGFADTPLMSPRAALFVADAEGLGRLDAMVSAPNAAPTLQRLDGRVPPTDGRQRRLARRTAPDRAVALRLARLHLTLPPQPPPRISAAPAD